MSINSAASTAAKPVPAGRRRVLHDHACLSFCLGLLIIGSHATAADQPPGCNYPHGQSITITHVHDGDTVVRADGERIRLIGIDTPELARDGQPAEAGAIAARNHLRDRIHAAATVTARYGDKRRDHYDRLLAHLYTDKRNVQADLLAAGLATPLFIAPNLAHADCYQQATAKARSAARGLWSRPQYQPRAAASLTGRERGYHVITGTAQRVGQSRCCIWLNLTPDFALRIERRYLPLFTTYNPAELNGKRLQARGYIDRRNNELRMSIRHPADLKIGRDEP